MEKLLKEASKKPREPFRPYAHYNEDGDLIEAAWDDCDYYAVWLNPQLTLLRKDGTDEVIGVQIWALDEDGKNRCIKNVVSGKRLKRKLA